jgi:MinD-like ATPase involved in chromosome partitioning or flagellar assembly
MMGITHAAALAASKGFDTALINYDLNCPDLDYWFVIRQTGLGNFDEASAGVMTFDDSFRPDLVARFMEERAFGVKYLPAGNKLGKIGVPVMKGEELEQILRHVCRRNYGRRPAITIIDAGSWWGNVWTLAALRLASVVLVPTDGTPASAAVINQHVEELTRLEIGSRFIECCLGPNRRPCWALDERLMVQFEWQEYLDAAASRKPMALRKECREVWDVMFSQL